MWDTVLADVEPISEVHSRNSYCNKMEKYLCSWKANHRLYFKIQFFHYTRLFRFLLPSIVFRGNQSGTKTGICRFQFRKMKKNQINQENEKLYSIWLIRLLKYNSVKRRFLVFQIKIQVSTFSHRQILSKLKHNLIDQETRSPINKQ